MADRLTAKLDELISALRHWYRRQRPAENFTIDVRHSVHRDSAQIFISGIVILDTDNWKWESVDEVLATPVPTLVHRLIQRRLEGWLRRQVEHSVVRYRESCSFSSTARS